MSGQGQNQEPENRPNHYENISIENIRQSAIAVGGDATVNIIHQPNAEPPPESVRFTVEFPYPDDKNFFGRKQELTQLHTTLQNENQVGIRPFGLTGMGGIGKTQLAVKYAYDYRPHYPGGVYWINAAEAIRPQLMKLAARLNRQPADLTSPDRNEQLIAALGSYLHSDEASLLIYDNVDDPNQFAKNQLGAGYTPFTLGPTIILTTRRNDLPENITPLNLNTLPAADAQAMLLNERPQASLQEINRLCRLLGNLPLGLKLAVASLRKRPNMTLTTYRQILKKEGAEIYHRKNKLTHKELGTYYDVSLTPALKAQWAMVVDEDARKSFRLAGQFPEAAEIPIVRLGLLTNIHDEPDGSYEPLSDAIAELAAASLVERLGLEQPHPPDSHPQGGSEPPGGFAVEGDHIRLHPLVRDFAAQQTPPQDRAPFLSQCAHNLAEAFEDPATLEDQWRQRGIYALQGDLMATLELVRGLETETNDLGIPPSKITRHISEQQSDADQHTLTRLQFLLRLLQREVYALSESPKNYHSNHFAQRIAYQLHNLGNKSLIERYIRKLKNNGNPFFQTLWMAKKESSALVRTLEGHSEDVNSVMVTPDGKRVVSASGDGTLKVWNLETGALEQTLKGHSSAWVNAVAVTPDGQHAVSASNDGTLKVWNLKTGTERMLRGRTHWGVSRDITVVVMPDGRQALASDGRTLKVWDISNFSPETGAKEQPLKDHSDWVNAVAVTPDGRQAVSASRDQTLKVWNLKTGTVELTFEEHSSEVNAVAVTPDGRQAISASNDKILYVWNLKTGTVERTFEGLSSGVNAVAVTPDGRQAILALNDKTLKVWNLKTGAVDGTLKGHSAWVNAVAVTPDGRRAVSASRDRTLKVWDISNISPEAGISERTFEGHSSGVNAVAVTLDGRLAVSASGDRTLKVWNLETGAEERTLDKHSGDVMAVGVTPDGRRAVSASTDKTLKVWNLETGLLERTLTGHSSVVGAVTVTPDGQRAVSASYGGTLKVWNLKTGVVDGNLKGHSAWVNAVAVTPDGRLAVSASDDQTLKVWDISNISSETGVAERTFEGHSSRVNAVAVTPDGRQVISASGDRTLKVWNIETGKQLASITLDEELLCIALSPNGRTIITGDQAGTVYRLEFIEPNPQP